MEKYQISLQGYENHSDLDYRIARKQIDRYANKSQEVSQSITRYKRLLSWLSYKDFTVDNIFIYLQLPIICIVIAYIWVAKAGLN